ncbi:hypothetical protein [Bacillus sp. FJAT-45350]|uniref:hypothetical protein n=1 Tax=Bacillus sp. FJAT-45350 TaxID=2011014 RepID=UPI000BB8A9C1|nr:hypothetical protein [Bacillus sp. FJAT-45350]
MELVVAIQSFEDLGIIQTPWGYDKLTAMEQETSQSFYNALNETIGELQPKRVYFGSEFCQYRLCDEDELIEAFEVTHQNGLQFSFAAPYLPQSGMKSLERLLNHLANYIQENYPEVEVEIICNDWGVLHFIKTYHGHIFTPVLGRLLNKMIRDPRVTQHYNREDAPKLANSQFKQSSYTVHYYRDFVKSAGVQLIEFDNTSQGLELEEGFSDFQIAIHFNYGCIATGRTCLVGSLHVEQSEKFRGHIACKQQCRQYTAEMINKHPRINSLQNRVFQKGNSVFFQQNFEQMKEGLQVAKQNNAHRIIYSPRLPV